MGPGLGPGLGAGLGAEPPSAAAGARLALWLALALAGCGGGPVEQAPGAAAPAAPEAAAVEPAAPAAAPVAERTARRRRPPPAVALPGRRLPGSAQASRPPDRRLTLPPFPEVGAEVPPAEVLRRLAGRLELLNETSRPAEPSP